MIQIFQHRNAETGKICGPATLTEATDPFEVRREYVSDQLRIACIIDGAIGRMVRVETLDEYGHVVSKSPGFGTPGSHHLPPSLWEDAGSNI